MLQIFKASAGAGKTHRLTGEYIKLLFGQSYAFKHILAVTFTNKATDEMKQRILQELFTLSQPGTGSDYLGQIMEFTGSDEQWVRGRAREILISILHDYTSFRVSTIDKFFQMVMRSFARELGKMATYNVELDRDSVLAKAVDRMFSNLDTPESRKLLDWLIEYSLDAVDKGSSWNVKGEIMRLGGQLFSEEFKLAMEACGESFEKSSVAEVALLKGSLKGIVDAFEKKGAALGNEGLGIMAGAGLSPDDFKGGSRSPFKYFGKLQQSGGKGGIEPPGASFLALHDDMGKWFAGKKCPAAIEGIYVPLNEVVGKIIGHFEADYRGYASACAVLANVNVLGILNDIYARVLEYCREKNIILLSESAQLLNRIIDGSDTPFVYEKIGVQLENYMLDEFQDTSSLQWRNFYPLLKNSLDESKDNLIVGDVKQSIYRWRGSDWKILGKEIFGQFREDEVSEESLDTNYRSGANIVEFNNSFFDFCAREVQLIYDEKVEGPIEEVYRGFAQNISGKGLENPGCVDIEFVPQSDELFEDTVLSMLPGKVEQLLQAGYAKRDIAVLVRKGKEGNLVARKLLECGYDIISSDSLYVASSVAVQKVVNVLREMDNPQSDTLRILKMFQNIPQTEQIGRYSLYQLCEAIIRETLVEEERKDVAFLQAFLDLVLDFTANHGTNIAQFVKWWDESGIKCTISAPEDMDAIRIMTIHKSKGLGFNVVIIPFLYESLDHQPLLSPNLWCSYKGWPVPVKYSKGLLDTEFADMYLNEKLCAYVDAMNTVYVAFTRPKRELVVFAPEPVMKKNGPSRSSMSDILYAYCSTHHKGDGEWQGKTLIGEHSAVAGGSAPAQKLVLENVFAAPLNEKRMRMAATSGSIGDGESIREHGIAMHYVFSLIDYPSSIPEAVAKACREGVASCSGEQLLEMVNSKIESVAGYGWFNSGWTVINECTILTKWGEERRPDRVITKGDEAVVIDYKFGTAHKENPQLGEKYKKQVSRYVELLTRMGYKNVKGYLWYLTIDEVICV